MLVRVAQQQVWIGIIHPAKSKLKYHAITRCHYIGHWLSEDCQCLDPHYCQSQTLIAPT